MDANSLTVGAESNQLEGGQRLAMRLVRDLPYMERLRQLNIFPLERKCLRDSLILAFKSFKSEADLSPSDFFLRPTRVWLRWHTYRLLQGPSRLRRRSGMYAVKYWNRLPVPLALSPSVPIFKKKVGPSIVRNPSSGTCVISVPLHHHFAPYWNPLTPKY